MAPTAVKELTPHLTLGQLMLAENALRRLASQSLAIKPAYHVGRLLKIVQIETATFHEQRNAFIKELGVEREATPDEVKTTGQTKLIEVTPENAEVFAARMKDLSDIDIKISDWLLTLDLLEGVKMTAIDMVLLDPLFATC
jgi:hypothetical protein